MAAPESAGGGQRVTSRCQRLVQSGRPFATASGSGIHMLSKVSLKGTILAALSDSFTVVLTGPAYLRSAKQACPSRDNTSSMYFCAKAVDLDPFGIASAGRMPTAPSLG